MKEQEKNTGPTYQLCEFLARSRFSDLPPEAVHAARRGLLDWLGCAFAGSTQPSLDVLLSVLREVGGREQATVLARKLKLGVLDAPIANGYMGHVLDYDDTHSTTLHPSSPVLSALLALCDHKSFRRVRPSFSPTRAASRSACAREGPLRVTTRAVGISPARSGALAAGAAAGKLLGLDARQLTYAVGIAGSQAAGLQQNRGTMPKYLHAGKAASSGVLSGLLAQRGFDASLDVMEGVRGFSRIYSEISQPERLTESLGAPWEITRNGHKPYASAVVLHSIVDAMIDLRSRGKIDLQKVSSIELTVHPYVKSITGVLHPESGMQSKFSLTHTAAVALFDGAGGITQYSDERVLNPQVKALRDKVRFTIDESLGVDQARARVTAGGETHESWVEHQSGTIANPMTDKAIVEKFMSNAEPVIGANRAAQVRELAWKIETLTDVRQLTAQCA